jgi:hypothetical protein
MLQFVLSHRDRFSLFEVNEALTIDHSHEDQQAQHEGMSWMLNR